MDKIYRSLADLNRRLILRMLSERDLNVNQISCGLRVGQSTVSSHLAILRKSGLVTCITNGKERIYKLNSLLLFEFIKDIKKMLPLDEIIVRR